VHLNQQTSSLSAYQQSAQTFQPNELKRSDLADMMHTIAEMHKVVSELHGIADRAVGMAGEAECGKLMPVPNGLVGEINDGLHAIHGRLNALYGRLSRIA
jgi:hypothetical protein